QMADDLLDYTQNTQALGKRAGADLLEGKLTLPVIHALAQASADERSWMEALIAAQSFTPEQLSQFITILEARGAIAYTRDRAAHHMARAKTILNGFAPGHARSVLMDIVDYAWARAS
ncbi:MAG: polyprenyl synthetase family protein, partial [Desulfatitalea sp.]|nr:polyprenyl synthetase family protein [Desulfatitalea sp.]